MDRPQRNPLIPSVRHMIQRDLPSCVSIECEAFEYPWDDKDFSDWAKHRTGLFTVAELGDVIAGFAFVHLEPTRIRLVKMAVHSHFRRRRIGVTLIADLAGRLSLGKRTHIVADVPEPNTDAQLFFRTCGFRAVGIIDNCGDVDYRFEYRLPAPAGVGSVANRITRQTASGEGTQ